MDIDSFKVQSYAEKWFSQRMFVYFYRTLDRFNEKVIAAAVYGNDQVPKNYDHFQYDFFKTKMRYEFNAFKVTDYLGREEELEQNPNIFAIVTLACLYIIKTKKGKNADEQRKALKLQLFKLLLTRNYDREEIKDLLAFINILITLPYHLENELKMEIIRVFVENRPTSIGRVR